MTDDFFADKGLDKHLARLRHGDHACSFYDNAAEQEALVISFMKEGLARGERCVYVVDDRTVEDLISGLGRAGVDVSREQERGALQFIGKAQWRNPGDFEVTAMAEGVKKLVNQALAPGWPGLWVAVEMTWALSPDIDPGRLAEWEAFWNNLITDMPAVLLCQYNRRRIPPAAIYLELKTHPLVVTPHEVYHNFYYEPPDLFLNQGAYGERVEWMLEQFQRARALEEERARRLRDQVARAQAEAANAALSQANEALRRSNEDLNQFAYAASHDLQEPLRMMAIYSQLLQKRYQGRLDGEADQFITFIVQGAQHMEVLLKGLLEYSRAASMSEQPCVPTDCNAALQKALFNLEATIKQSGACVTADPLPMVRAHDTSLLQLLQNLVGNALKYRGKEAPQVHISAERRGAEWVFSVRDNGIGIDPQYARQIFGIFKRLHGREYPGTGIGLAICQKIVERYGGHIWVESERGKGATFYFTVPAEKSH
jgi:signal transduction histidine kinase